MGFKRPLNPLGRRHRSGSNSWRNKGVTLKELGGGEAETDVFDRETFPAGANPINRPIEDEESE